MVVRHFYFQLVAACQMSVVDSLSIDRYVHGVAALIETMEFFQVIKWN